jgi:hypothetical protein
VEEELLNHAVTENNTPVTNLSPSSPSKPKRKRIFLLIILILLIVCCGFGFCQVKQSHKSQIAIQPSVHPTNAVLNEIQAEQQAKKFLQKSLQVDGKREVFIPGTDLEIQIPTSYQAQPFQTDTMLTETTLLSYKSELPSDLQPFLNHPGGWWGDFIIGTIQTSLSPQQWVLDNIVQQGIKLKDEPPSISRGTKITINGNEFLIVNIGCCGSDYFVYFLQYTNLKGQKSIIIFATHNSLGAEDKTRQRNIVLDTILTTLTHVNMEEVAQVTQHLVTNRKQALDPELTDDPKWIPVYPQGTQIILDKTSWVQIGVSASAYALVNPGEKRILVYFRRVKGHWYISEIGPPN